MTDVVRYARDFNLRYLAERFLSGADSRRDEVTFEGMIVASNGAVAELLFEAENETSAKEFLRDYVRDEDPSEYDIEPVGGTRMVHVRPDGADDGDWDIEVVTA